MTVIEIIDAFTFYGLDVILLAAATAVAVQLCKVTFLKRLNRKIVTFLPFTLGTLFYAAYAAGKNLSLAYLVTEYVSVLEHGVAVGAAATLLYVLYEQFVREKKQGLTAAEGVIATLIEGYVPTKSAERVAKLVAEAIEKDLTGGGAERVAKLIAENANADVSERDVELLAKLVIEAVAHLNGARA